jgi:hypothetical protein
MRRLGETDEYGAFATGGMKIFVPKLCRARIIRVTRTCGIEV